MKWRTDKPTADIIVAEIKDRGYKIMYISNADINYYLDDNGEEYSYTDKMSELGKTLKNLWKNEFV